MEFPDLVPELKEIIAKLLGPTSEELGIWFREKVRFLRFKSSIKVFNRAKEKLIEAGFSEPKLVDLKTLIPLLENCSLENEDSELIEKWAGLLSSAIAFGLKTYTYPYILNQLSPDEVKVLDALYDFSILDTSNNKWYKTDQIKYIINITETDLLIYLDNLFRLSLCRSRFASTIDHISDEVEKLYGEFTLTPLGIDFIKSCKGPDAKN